MSEGSGVRIQGSGIRIQELMLRVQVLGLRAQGVPESRSAAGSGGRRRERTCRVQCLPVHSGPWSRASALAPACSTCPEGSKTVALTSESDAEGARCAIETPPEWGSADEPSTGKRDVIVALGVGSSITWFWDCGLGCRVV